MRCSSELGKRAEDMTYAQLLNEARLPPCVFALPGHRVQCSRLMHACRLPRCQRAAWSAT